VGLVVPKPVPFIVILQAAGRLSWTLVMTGSVVVVAVTSTTAKLQSASMSAIAINDRGDPILNPGMITLLRQAF
jgi:hypothetical protein